MNAFIYKTTNLINGKIYIGQHSNRNQNYFGSGIKLNSAIKHYGKENFKREIIHDNIPNQKALDILEKHYIKKFDSCNPEIGYNILPGTANGFGDINPMNIPEIRERSFAINKKTCSDENYRKKQSIKALEYFKTHPSPFLGRRHTLELKLATSVRMTKYYQEHDSPFKNKKHTEEAKRILSEKAMGRGAGEKNPNYGNKWDDGRKKRFSELKSEQYKGAGNPRFGKYWVNDGTRNMSATNGEPVPDGFVKGMIRINKEVI